MECSAFRTDAPFFADLDRPAKEEVEARVASAKADGMGGITYSARFAEGWGAGMGCAGFRFDRRLYSGVALVSERPEK